MRIGFELFRAESVNIVAGSHIMMKRIDIAFLLFAGILKNVWRYAKLVNFALELFVYVAKKVYIYRDRKTINYNKHVMYLIELCTYWTVPLMYRIL